MELIIRKARKEWVCFDCSEDIIIGESHYEGNIKDLNSTKENRESNLKLCKDCGNRWIEKWGNSIILNTSQKIGKLLSRSQAETLLRKLKQENAIPPTSKDEGILAGFL